MPQEFIVQGRVVAGHPGKLRDKKNQQTKQTVMKDGQPVKQTYFGVAVEKGYFNQQILPLMQAEVKSAFPNAFPNPAVLGGLQGLPDRFSWKIKDGDGYDSQGKPFNTREGYAGHYVINFTSEGFAPQLFRKDGNNYFQINPDDLKCGDYVAVKTSIKYNGATGTNTPGLYVNPNMVLLIGYGAEIVSSAQDPEEAFAGYQAQLPAGAMTAPAAGAPAAPQVYTPPPVATAPAAPQPYVAPVAAPAAPALPPPAPDFVNNVVNAAPPAPPVAVFPPAGWFAHPTAGYFHNGTEVLTEQQLREKMGMPGMPAPR